VENSPRFSLNSAKSKTCHILRPFRYLWLRFPVFHRCQGHRRGLFLFFPVNPLNMSAKLLAFWDLPKIARNRAGISRIFAKFREVQNVPHSATIPLHMAPLSCVPWMSGAAVWVVPPFSGQSPNYECETSGVLRWVKNRPKSWKNLQDFRQIPRSPKRATFCDHSATYGSAFLCSIDVRGIGVGGSSFFRSIP